MDFEFSERTRELQLRVQAFMDEHVYPNEGTYGDQVADGDTRWATVPILEELKAKAKEEGLWNLFLPESDLGAGLTNMEYAPLCEITGLVNWVAVVLNCYAPVSVTMLTLVI